MKPETEDAAMKQGILFFAVQRSSDSDSLELCRILCSSVNSSLSASDLVNSKDVIGQTPLFYAALVGNAASCVAGSV